MNSKSTSKATIVMVCLCIVGVIAIAASLIAIKTDSGAEAWARNLIRDTSETVTDSEDTPESQDTTADGALAPHEAIRDHIEWSHGQLEQHIGQIPKSTEDVEANIKLSLEAIDAHIDWTRERLDEHIERSQERYEELIGKD